MTEKNRRIFNYKNIDYEIIENTENGFKQTKPLNGIIEPEVYETGHYSVNKMKFIPILVSIPDFLYFLFILKRCNFSKSKSLLDFGCGKGYFLFFLKVLRFNLVGGVETSIPRADFADRLLKFNVLRDHYYSGKIGNKSWHFIVLIHVLEHIDNPFIFLDNLIDQALTEKGKILIEVPNIQSISSSIAKNTWAHFTPHFHTNHFTKRSLQDYCLTRNRDFKIIGTFSFYHGYLGMSSANLIIFGYQGSLFEDVKSKKLGILIVIVMLFPISFTLELISAVFFNRGSVIKIIIKK